MRLPETGKQERSLGLGAVLDILVIVFFSYRICRQYVYNICRHKTAVCPVDVDSETAVFDWPSSSSAEALLGYSRRLVASIRQRRSGRLRMRWASGLECLYVLHAAILHHASYEENYAN